MTGLTCDYCEHPDAYWVFFYHHRPNPTGPKYCLRCMAKITRPDEDDVEEGEVSAQESVACPQILAAENEGLPSPDTGRNP